MSLTKRATKGAGYHDAGTPGDPAREAAQGWGSGPAICSYYGDQNNGGPNPFSTEKKLSNVPRFNN